MRLPHLTLDAVIPADGFVELDTDPATGRPCVAVWATRDAADPILRISISEGEPDAEHEMAAAVADEMSRLAEAHADIAVRCGGDR
ncbi:hypothetical protein GCM10027294_43440 [Marinactinospora endophytica]